MINLILCKLRCLILALTLVSLLLMAGCSKKEGNNHVNVGSDISAGAFQLPSALQSTAIQSGSVKAWITISGESGPIAQREAMILTGEQATFENKKLKAGVYAFTIEFEADFLNNNNELISVKLATARKSNVTLGIGNNSLSFAVSDYLYPDDDLDGVFNITELKLGTDPHDVDSKPAVSCTIINGNINCSENIFLVGGSVQGLTADGLVLLNNDDVIGRLALPANTVDFKFNQRLSQGADYNVSVLSQPKKQFCFVNNNTGIIEQNDIIDVAVICSNASEISGIVTGLNGTLVLDNNGEQATITNADVRINAPFIFNTSLPTGQRYDVTVVAQPENQFCTVLQGSGFADNSDVSTVMLNCLSDVKPHYLTNGAGWTHYVANDGVANYKATGAACSSNSPGYESCVHGGEIYSVVLRGVADCSGVSAADDLKFFDWVCDDSANAVTIVSTGLKPGVRLSNLIDFTGVTASWKRNTLTVFVNGEVHGLTPSTPWLAGYSPIVPADNGLAPGTSKTGDIYVVTTDAKSAFVLDSDNIALVVQPGVKLSGPAAGVNVIDATNAASFVWIEGDIISAGDRGVLVNANHSVVDNLMVSSSTGIGVTIGASNSIIKNIKVASNGSAGFSGNDGIVTLPDSENNQFLSVFSTNNNYMGIRSQGTNETWINIVSSNNNRGFVFEGHDNRYIGVTSNNNANEGITFGGAPGFAGNNVMINATSVNNGYLGLDINNRSNMSIMNLAIAANARDTTGFGLFVTNSSNHTFANVVIANNAGIGYMGSASFTGIVSYGNNFDAICTGCDTTPTDPVITYDVDIADSFVAEAGSDVINTTEQIAGGARMENITDWIRFENRFRAWGGSHVQVFPDLGDRKNCRTGEICAIWDWSLRINDVGNAGLPVLHGVLAHPTNLSGGEQTLKHTWSVKSQQACEAIPGAIWEINTCYSVFLRNAIEVAEGNNGNSNGLCESNETCLYSPNIASYQGHGTLVPSGTYTGEGVTGVILLQYLNNGY